MATQKSILVQALEEEISSVELQKKEIEAQIEELNKSLKEAEQKISDYRVALNHAKEHQNRYLLANPKFRNRRFQSSPQQLIAQILKENVSIWLSTKDITRQAMKLDEQQVKEKIPYKQSQTIACTLNYLKYKSLVEKCLIDNSQHWRLRPLEQGQ